MKMWTDKESEVLTAHFKNGFSAKESAETLSKVFKETFTKNAVIGRRHRLGLIHGVYFKDIAKANAARAEARRQAQDEKAQKRAALEAHQAKKRAEIERTVAARAEKAKQQAEQQKQAKPKEQIIVHDVAGDITDTKEAIMSLQPHHCRFPFGQAGKRGFRFCCEPRQKNSSYCVEHHARCSVKIEPRSRMKAARV